MEIAVVASLLAEWDVDVDSCHGAKLRNHTQLTSCSYRQMNNFDKKNLDHQ